MKSVEVKTERAKEREREKSGHAQNVAHSSL